MFDLVLTLLLFRSNRAGISRTSSKVSSVLLDLSSNILSVSGHRS